MPDDSNDLTVNPYRSTGAPIEHRQQTGPSTFSRVVIGLVGLTSISATAHTELSKLKR